jgi:Domain of unknown function (DUF202)
MPTEATPDRHTEVAASRTAEAAERTKETAVRTTVAAQRTEASADRRTELAANRTVLAAERTYAAWVRTGLMSLAAGVGAKKTLGGVLPEWVVVVTGSVLVAFAALLFPRRCLARAVSGRTAAPARRASPPAGIAVRVERLPRTSGARRAARRLVWPHRRELTTAIGLRGRLQVRWPQMIAGMAGTGAPSWQPHAISGGRELLRSRPSDRECRWVMNTQPGSSRAGPGQGASTEG